MKCLECLKKYIGQTGRNFNIRYKENIHDINSSNGNPGYANHILNTGHAYGTMTDTMNIITIGKKGKHLNTLEMKKTKSERHKHTETYNPIFQVIHELSTEQHRTTPRSPHPNRLQYIYIYIYIYFFFYLTAIGLLPGGSVYKRTYIQQGNHTYISRHHTAQHK
jgi:hypothetical protein